MELDNLSRFAATSLPAYSRDGDDLHVVCVAARFDFPAKLGDPPTLAESQPDPILEDQYWGAPGGSSLRMEGQGIYERPGADIYVSGHAWTPGGKPLTQLAVALRVGPLVHHAMVFGERVWQRSLAVPQPSTPLPFVSMPLTYERAFGAPDDLHNPVGCGLHRSTSDAIDRALPNLEDPRALLTSVGDHPRPVGFSPIARHWHDRLQYAGTYDANWVETRAPFWPMDLDMRFFNAASPGLVLPRRLQANDEVVLEGLSPQGRVAFHLPGPRLLLKHYFEGYQELEWLEADAMQIEPDSGAFTLYYRAAVARGHGDDAYLGSVLRQAHAWEDIQP